MVNEAEFRQLERAYASGTQAIKDYRARRNTSLAETPIADLRRPLRQLYARFCRKAGFDPVVVAPNHILKHRLAAFGPQCHACGRPLRTPAAARCAECGATRKA